MPLTNTTTPCRHGPAKQDIDPATGDVWCFACKPPRNLTAEWMQACRPQTDHFHPVDVAILGGDPSL